MCGYSLLTQFITESIGFHFKEMRKSFGPISRRGAAVSMEWKIQTI